MDARYTPGPWNTANLRNGEEPSDGAMGRVTFCRDRFVGIDAGNELGTFATREIAFTGRQLTVNAEPTVTDAELRVQVVRGDSSSPTGFFPKHDGMPIEGLTFDCCRPLSANGLDTPVTWESASNLSSWAGKSVRLQFHLRSMRIYGFRFTK